MFILRHNFIILKRKILVHNYVKQQNVSINNFSGVTFYLLIRKQVSQAQKYSSKSAINQADRKKLTGM